MDGGKDRIDGYIRLESQIRILDSAATVTGYDPKYGFLDLLTEDGRLHLLLSESCAEDLLVDLQQFLKARPPSSS